MNVLPLEFNKNGFTYRQFKREGNVAIYTQHCKGLSGKPLAYEVVIIKKHDGYEITGNKIEAAEMYPGNEAFGVLGWTFSTLMKDSLNIALDKMAKVIQDIKNKSKT